MKNSLRSILILTGNDVVVMIFTQEAPPTQKWFSGRSCIRSNWNYKLGVNFEEGGNRSARRKPSKSGRDRLKLNAHTTFVQPDACGSNVFFLLTTVKLERIQTHYFQGINLKTWC